MIGLLLTRVRARDDTTQVIATKSGEETLEVWDKNAADPDATPFSLIIMVFPRFLRANVV